MRVRQQRIQDADPQPGPQQQLDDVGSDEPGSARDQYQHPTTVRPDPAGNPYKIRNLPTRRQLRTQRNA
jgi:hypothetical protein